VKRRTQDDDDDALPGVDDGRFHRREVSMQRVGMAALGLFLLAGLAGVFGSGPLSSAQIDAGNGTRVEYQRLARAASPIELRLTTLRADPPVLQLWLSRSFVDAIELEDVTPEPERVAIHGDRLLIDIAVATPRDSLPVTVVLGYQPRAMGRIHGEIGLAGGPAARFRQVIFP
jgi:hypothetical protein